MEVENIVLIVIFALLLFFVSMTGIIAYHLCALEPVVHTPRTWSAVLSVLVLALIRMDRYRPEHRNTPDRIDEEPDEMDIEDPSPPLVLCARNGRVDEKVDVVIHQCHGFDEGSL